MIALRPFIKGDVIEVDGKKVELIDDIERGHKIALNDIEDALDEMIDKIIRVAGGEKANHEKQDLERLQFLRVE